MLFELKTLSDAFFAYSIQRAVSEHLVQEKMNLRVDTVFIPNQRSDFIATKEIELPGGQKTPTDGHWQKVFVGLEDADLPYKVSKAERPSRNPFAPS